MRPVDSSAVHTNALQTWRTHVAGTTVMSIEAVPFEFAVKLPFRSARHAECVQAALDVDPEFRPQEVKRTLCLEGSNLRVVFAASNARMLRASVGTFLDLLALAVDTLETFQDSIRP